MKGLVLFLVLSTFAFVAVSAHSEEAMQAMSFALSKLHHLRGKQFSGRQLPEAFFQTLNNLEGLKKREDPSQACIAVLTEAGKHPECDSSQPGFDAETACEVDGCKAVYRSIVVGCNENDVDRQFALLFRFLGNIICLQDEAGNYCFNEFEKLAATESSVLTEDQLEIICSPCFFKLINVLIAFQSFFPNSTDGDDPRFELDLLCTKANGEFCVLTLQDDFPTCVDSGAGSVSDVACITDNLNFLCKNLCFKKILSKLWVYLDPTVEDALVFSSMLKFVCTQDEAGQFCLALFEQEDALRKTVCSEETFNTVGCANATCEVAINTFVNNTGCCLQTFFDFQVEQGAVQTSDVEFFKDFLQTTCSVGTFDAACLRIVGSDRASRSFFFRLHKEFLQSLKDKTDFQENCRRDFVGNLALWEGDVTIEFLENTAIEDGDFIIIEAVITFQAENDQLQTDIEISFDEDAANGRLSFPNAGGQYAALFGDPLEASVEPPADDESSGNGNGNGSAQLGASLLFVAAAAVLVM